MKLASKSNLTNRKQSFSRLAGCVVPVLLLASLAIAAEPAKAAAAPAKPPVWLTDLSVGLKESYDDNIFLVSGDGAPKQESWLTTVSPKVGVNFAPLLKDQKVLQVLSLGYAPDFVVYHDQSSESFNAHRLAATLKGKAGAFSFNLDNGFNFIDGSETAPVYSRTLHDDQRSAYSTSAPRERREQIQDRAKIVLQYDWKKCFIRPTATLLYYDLMTDQRTNAGYQNYCDRYDVNGGLDFGYKITPAMAVTLGYRYGHQYQEEYPTAIDATHTSSPSDYHRVLFGFEGKPLTWLTFSVQAGPDFRSYPATTASHTTPLGDKNPVTYYAESSLTATITPSDALTFKYKQWQFVASTGKLPLFDSSYDLSYRHKFGKSLTLDLGAKLASSDYTVASGTSSLRNDAMWTGSAGLTYAFTSHLSANLAYVFDLGRNQQDVLAAGQTEKYREFDRNLISLGAAWKF